MTPDANTPTHTHSHATQEPRRLFQLLGLLPQFKASNAVTGARGAQKWYVSVLSINKWYAVFFQLFASPSSIIVFVATKQLRKSAIRMNTPSGVRYVACHVQVALLLCFWALLSVVPIGASFVLQQGFGCVCLSHVSGWLRLVEVFAVVPLGVSCFLSCRVRGCFVACKNVGAQASRPHWATGGTSCADVGCSGRREPVAWVQMQLTGNGVFKIRARPCQPP